MAKKEKRNQKGHSTNRANDSLMDKAENTTRNKSHGAGSQTHDSDAYTGSNRTNNNANDCR